MTRFSLLGRVEEGVEEKIRCAVFGRELLGRAPRTGLWSFEKSRVSPSLCVHALFFSSLPLLLLSFSFVSVLVWSQQRRCARLSDRLFGDMRRRIARDLMYCMAYSFAQADLKKSTKMMPKPPAGSTSMDIAGDDDVTATVHGYDDGDGDDIPNQDAIFAAKRRRELARQQVR